MAHPQARPQRRAQLPLKKYLLEALAHPDWRHQIYMFEWAIENLSPPQLAEYYKSIRYYRGNYHIRVEEVVSRMELTLREYQTGRRVWRGPTAKVTTQIPQVNLTAGRAGNYGRNTISSRAMGGCGCGCSGGCGGSELGFFLDQINDMTNAPLPPTTPTGPTGGNKFDPTNPFDWMKAIEQGTGVVTKIGCMADPKLPFCTGATAAPQNLDELCKQAPSSPACIQYQILKQRGAFPAAPVAEKKDNTGIIIAAAVGAGVLLLGMSQPKR